MKKIISCLGGLMILAGGAAWADVPLFKNEERIGTAAVTFLAMENVPRFTALGNAGNWTALVPDSSKLLVTLRALNEAENTIVLHPVGTLRITQKAVPLDLTIDKVGNRKTRDVRKLWIQVPNGPLKEVGEVSIRGRIEPLVVYSI